jgi:hypothetical protein
MDWINGKICGAVDKTLRQRPTRLSLVLNLSTLLSYGFGNPPVNKSIKFFTGYYWKIDWTRGGCFVWGICIWIHMTVSYAYCRKLRGWDIYSTSALLPRIVGLKLVCLFRLALNRREQQNISKEISGCPLLYTTRKIELFICQNNLCRLKEMPTKINNFRRPEPADEN